MISLENVGRSFCSNTLFRGVNLRLSKGSVTAIRGDNGSGKTTLLNIVAGIDNPTEGVVTIAHLRESPPRISYAQQDYTSSLLPWMNVVDNIAIPLRIAGVSKSARRQKVKEQIETLGIRNLPLDLFPHQLSGGQRQKVAIARSLIHDPDVLILDEPFANLDAHTTLDLQEALIAFQERRRPTTLFVSHDLDQCLFFADEILLLHGRPSTIVHRFAINLPRPRPRDVFLKSEYLILRDTVTQLEDALYHENRAV